MPEFTEDQEAPAVYPEGIIPAPFAGEGSAARIKALATATPEALPSPVEKGKTPSAGEVNGGAPPELWARPGSLHPFLSTLGELTAVIEEMRTLYRQGTNALSDWEQLGLYLTAATELNSDLRRQALRLPLVPVEWLISRVAAESGLPGIFAGSQEPVAELSGETAAKLVAPLAALIKGLGWTKTSRREGVEAPKPILFTAEQKEELLTLTAGSGHPTVTGVGGEDLWDREELDRITESIGQVQGRLEIDPAGNWFQITAPVLPATIRCLLFQAGAEEYALPARNYLYHLTIKREEVRRSRDLTFISRYPEVIPLVVAADFTAPLEGEGTDLTLILLAVERMRLALPVTRVEGYDELLQTDPDRPVVKGPLSFAKAYRRNGRPVLLADAGELAGLIPRF